MPFQLVEILARLRVKPKNPLDLSMGSVNTRIINTTIRFKLRLQFKKVFYLKIR